MRRTMKGDSPRYEGDLGPLATPLFLILKVIDYPSALILRQGVNEFLVDFILWPGFIVCRFFHCFIEDDLSRSGVNLANNE